MSRKLVTALVLMGLAVVVLILNRSGVSLDLGFTEVSTVESFAYLGFLAVGVVVGMLLK